ncbi:MAG: NAD(P)/FAD-dependent oxidoreductase [Geobacteraceae bacterium]
MPFLIRNLALDYRITEPAIFEHLLSRLSLDREEAVTWKIIRKGLDARKKKAIRYVYTIEISVRDEAACLARFADDGDITHVPETRPKTFPPIAADKEIVIVGMGPAGLFAALRLAEYGLRATIIERGRPVEQRVQDVQTFWDRGVLNPESNVQFGEGGAGTFSDGKLTTRIRDENLGYILENLVRFGAPREILCLAKPHIGTDKLRRVVAGIRAELLERGFTIRFSGKLTDIMTSKGQVSGLVLNGAEELPCHYLVLATGHSARDTYEMLRRRSVHMERKPFAIGLRVEHPQELINSIQYGNTSAVGLPTAEYVLSHHDPETDRPVYSFCMCPGGVVMAAASEEGGVVTNGMSSFQRNSPFANSALVVAVGEKDFPGSDPFAGIEFQRALEQKAFAAGNNSYYAPAQNLMDFATGKGFHDVRSSYRPGIVSVDLAEILPKDVALALKAGVKQFDRKMRGFLTVEASLTGVESRTSAPVRIVRGDTYQSVSLPGLFPTGEGAGYAGGIMSAAVDGIRVADSIARDLQLK